MLFFCYQTNWAPLPLPPHFELTKIKKKLTAIGTGAYQILIELFLLPEVMISSFFRFCFKSLVKSCKPNLLRPLWTPPTYSLTHAHSHSLTQTTTTKVFFFGNYFSRTKNDQFLFVLLAEKSSLQNRFHPENRREGTNSKCDSLFSLSFQMIGNNILARTLSLRVVLFDYFMVIKFDI